MGILYTCSLFFILYYFDIVFLVKRILDYLKVKINIVSIIINKRNFIGIKLVSNLM